MTSSHQLKQGVSEYVPDYLVDEWEYFGEKFLLYVCSSCGLICNEMLDHGDCLLQDWWHLNVKGISPCPKCGGNNLILPKGRKNMVQCDECSDVSL